MLTKCNCGHEFEIKLEIKEIGDGIEQVYFKCPKCPEEYNVTKTTPEIRAKQERINMLSYRASIQKDSRIKTKLLKDMERTTQEKKKLMEQLE